MGGVYYSILTAADKSLTISTTDTRSDPPVLPPSQNLSVVNKSGFNINTSGYILGIGASWDPWLIRVVLEVTYRDTFGSITREKSRFSENQLAGIGDIDDEISLQNISTSISFLFPLRFINEDFSAF